MGEKWLMVRLKRGSLFLPAGRPRITRNALLVYRPITARAKLAWRASRALAPLASLALRRAPPPPNWLRERLSTFVPKGGAFTYIQSWHAERFHALLLDASGAPAAFVKVGRGNEAERALLREAQALESLKEPLGPDVEVPPLFRHEPGLLVMAPVDWTFDEGNQILPPELTVAMGNLWRNGRETLEKGTSHGDFAPTNVLKTATGWVIVDWERVSSALEPFADIFHYLVQSHVLLRNPSADRLLDGVFGERELASIFETYARAAGLDVADVPANFETYLRRSRAWRKEGEPGHTARSALLDHLRRRRKHPLT